MTTCTTRASYAALVALASLVALAMAAEQPRDTSGPLQLRFAFHAIDAAGQPVPDLTADALALSLDGRVEPVRSVTWISTDARASSGGSTDVPYLVTGTYKGRDVVLVIDTTAVPPSSRNMVLQSVAALFEGLAPEDRVRLVAIGQPGHHIDPTRHHDRVRAAVEALRFNGSDVCRTRDLAGILFDVLTHWSPEVAPVVVVLSSVSTVSAAPTGDYCPLAEAQRQFLERIAESSVASVFLIQVPNRHGEMTSNSGLADLARRVDGVEVRASEERMKAVATIAARTRGYYRTTILVPAGAADQEPKIALRSLRAHVRIRAPARVAVARDGTSAGQILHAGGDYTGLPLRAALFLGGPVEEPGVVAVFESSSSVSSLSQAVVGIFDVRGRLVARWTASRDDFDRAPVLAVLKAAPGPYRIRLAAIDQQGRAGAIDAEVDIALPFAAGLRRGSLMVGVLEDGRLMPRLRFTTEPSAAIELELFGAADDISITPILDLVGPTLNTDERVVRVTGTAAVAAGTHLGRRLIRGQIPLGSLDRGEYLLRLHLTVNGREAVSIIHRMALE